MMLFSVIFVHYSTDEYKSNMARQTLQNLRSTLTDECELIVVNNGERDESFEELCDIYIKSDRNSLGHARNLGFENSSSEFVCFVDNDVLLQPGWWQECLRLLKKYSAYKLIASPVHTASHVDIVRRRRARICQRGDLDGNLLNTRSGSNCLVMRRSTFQDIGNFLEIAPNFDGVEFCDRQNAKGYLMILTNPPMARDLGTYQYHYQKA